MNTFSHISCETLNQDRSEWKVVDIRDPQSYSLSHVEGATQLNNDTLNTFMAETEKTQPVAVMCYHGISSQQAAAFLVAQGYENVASVDGGFEHWRQHFPVVGE